MNIYVGNLSYSLTEDDLRALFAEFGDVTSAKLIMDRYTGQSKGFGFVEMSDDGAAQKAIDELNGRDVSGRSLTVNKARPREERPRGGGGRGGYGDRAGLAPGGAATAAYHTFHALLSDLGLASEHGFAEIHQGPLRNKQ